MDSKRNVRLTIQQRERLEDLQASIEDARVHLSRLESDLEDEYFADISSYLDCVRDMLDFDWNELSDKLTKDSRGYGDQF